MNTAFDSDLPGQIGGPRAAALAVKAGSLLSPVAAMALAFLSVSDSHALASDRLRRRR